MSDATLPSGTLPAVAPRRRRAGFWPLAVTAALGFLFVLGFSGPGDPPGARVVLALAAAVAAASILLLGQVVLTLVGRQRTAESDGLPSLARLEEEKRQVLLAIKELEFDRAMGKINERDHQELKRRYEAEALALLKAIDEDHRHWRARAESLAQAHLEAAGLGDGAARAQAAPSATPPVATGATESVRRCAGCGVENDPDARFCKRCGGRLEEAA